VFAILTMMSNTKPTLIWRVIEKEGDMKRIYWVLVGFIVLTYLPSYAILKEAQELPRLSPTEQVTRALHKSIKAHNVAALHVAVSLGADVNAYDPVTGYTPLIEAIVEGDVALVRALRTCGADCSKCDEAGNSVDYYVQLLREKKPKNARTIMHVLHEAQL
ncbi:MAG: hypothetical protein ACHQVS_04245, partial [Candidatus Babeliales bacterium]